MLNISRRNLFGGMSVMGLLVFAQALWGKIKSGQWSQDDGCYLYQPHGNPLRHKGFTLFWSDWMPSQFSANLVGVWKAWPVGQLAKRLKLPYLYAACPGAEGNYQPGDSWDLIPQEGQVVVEKETSDQIKGSLERGGLKRLIALIDSRDWQGASNESSGLSKYYLGSDGGAADGLFDFKWSGWVAAEKTGYVIGVWKAYPRGREKGDSIPWFQGVLPEESRESVRAFVKYDTRHRLAAIAPCCRHGKEAGFVRYYGESATIFNN